MNNEGIFLTPDQSNEPTEPTWRRADLDEIETFPKNAEIRASINGVMVPLFWNDGVKGWRCHVNGTVNLATTLYALVAYLETTYPAKPKTIEVDLVAQTTWYGRVADSVFEPGKRYRGTLEVVE